MNTESNCAGTVESGAIVRRQVGDDQSVTEAVVRTVAAASGRDATAAGAGTADGGDALEPIYRAIDPDALDALFDAAGETDRSSVEVTFAYAGYEVTVDGNGRVTAREQRSPGA